MIVVVKKMNETIDATFDGKVFRPEKPVGLMPNTHVKIIVKTEPPTKDRKLSFLQTAKELKLEGPRDWSENIDEYLYGKEIKDEQ
jgi:predicted DNA-binding antitoxin AbrB/MazE fold protein